jgi:putative transposase
MQLQGSLSVERMCQLAAVSRAGFYRHLKGYAPRQEGNEVRNKIQEIVVENRRRYGSPRITKELTRRGFAVNHKRVERIMREDNLLAVRWRKFVTTTDSEHEQRLYWNLASRMEVSGINQLWVADITYIRLRDEFVYLAVVLDVYSRQIVGWALERTLQARLAVTALERAIAARGPAPGLVHHSDRGIQYACADYVAILERHQIVASMSRAQCPWDNAICESWMKTLKQEEIYANQYRDQADLEVHLKEFIEQYYNKRRLHSALGYRSPEEFEAAVAAGAPLPKPDPRAAALSFPRHGRSINRVLLKNPGKEGRKGSS